jgi:uncharacterized protein YndB with AHSA1/START domain
MGAAGVGFGADAQVPGVRRCVLRHCDGIWDFNVGRGVPADRRDRGVRGDAAVPRGSNRPPAMAGGRLTKNPQNGSTIMTMQATEQELEIQTGQFSKTVDIDAPIDITFEATLLELGPEGQMPDGKPFPFVFEPWPGGRWYRDLGNNAGHLWGHVQVIKPPKLLEICGPMPFSFPATNHLQYRLTADGDERTRLKLTHRAFGYMPKDYLAGMDEGWDYWLKRVGEIASRLKNDQQKSAKR